MANQLGQMTCIFPVVILGTGACIVALAVLDPAMIGEPNPLRRRWKFCRVLISVFQILRSLQQT